jgi:hypothetical protein
MKIDLHREQRTIGTAVFRFENSRMSLRISHLLQGKRKPLRGILVHNIEQSTL